MENKVGILVPNTRLKSRDIVPRQQIVDLLQTVAGWNGAGRSYHEAAGLWAIKVQRALGTGGSSSEDLMKIVRL